MNLPSQGKTRFARCTKQVFQRFLRRISLIFVCALPGCGGLHRGDPVLGPLDRFLNRPVINLSDFLGPPSGTSGLLERRSYSWEFRDSNGRACSLVARVDGQEGVIDIERRGAQEVCAQFVEERARLAR